MSGDAPSLGFLFGSAFVIGLSGAMSPGPVLTATIGEALRRGASAGPLMVLGHAILELLLVVALVAGLAAWLAREGVMSALGVLGGALLVAMGVQMVATARAQTERAFAATPGGEASRVPPGRPVLMGVLLSLANPYWALWWATIGLNLAAVALRRGAGGLGVFYSGHILADLAWYSAVAFAVSRGRRVCPPRVYRALLVACGVALGALGARFLGEGAGGAAAPAHQNACAPSART